jgi:hypothetical protein
LKRLVHHGLSSGVRRVPQKEKNDKKQPLDLQKLQEEIKNMESHIVSLTAMHGDFERACHQKTNDCKSRVQSTTKELGLLVDQMKDTITTITSVVAQDPMPDEPDRESKESPKRKQTKHR